MGVGVCAGSREGSEDEFVSDGQGGGVRDDVSARQQVGGGTQDLGGLLEQGIRGLIQGVAG